MTRDLSNPERVFCACGHRVELHDKEGCRAGLKLLRRRTCDTAGNTQARLECAGYAKDAAR